MPGTMSGCGCTGSLCNDFWLTLHFAWHPQADAIPWVAETKLASSCMNIMHFMHASVDFLESSLWGGLHPAKANAHELLGLAMPLLDQIIRHTCHMEPQAVLKVKTMVP